MPLFASLAAPSIRRFGLAHRAVPAQKFSQAATPEAAHFEGS
jgi:hypothetical protein